MAVYDKLAEVRLSVAGEPDALRYRVEVQLAGRDYVIVLDDYRTVAGVLEDAARRIAGAQKPGP